MELNIMDKTKCITFDPVAQEALPDHIKAKMKADRDKAKLEAYHKQCPCCIIRKTKCFDFWERNVLFPKTKRSFFRTPTPLPCPFPLNFSLLIITKKFGNLAKNRYICIV